MTFQLVEVSLAQVRPLFEQFHAYESLGNLAVYAWGVIESGRIVAAYVWNPPPPGAAISVLPELPCGVLALSRMVAVPKSDRVLKHISKPLRQQIKHLIDRTRWPVLITYSDASCGHNGYVYKCSGWTPTVENEVDTLTTPDGKRMSRYSNGGMIDREGVKGTAIIQRWEHRVTDPAGAFNAIWERVAIPGKKWRSGSQAYTYRKKVDARAQIEMFAS